jgi:cell division transport system permease protein
MKIWLREHRFALIEALRTLWKTPGNFLLNVLVVSVALFLPIGGLTILENVRSVSSQLSVEPEVSVFLTMDTSLESARMLHKEILLVLPRDIRGTKVEFIPRDTALEALKKKTELYETLNSLGNNPLPHAYVIRLPDATSGAVNEVVEKLAKLASVETVQIDSVWMKRLAALIHVLRLALFILAFTLGLVVLAVVFNTVRLQVLTQKEEIIISRLLGATDAFIYRPFYYAGALLGLCAGGIALGGVALFLPMMNEAVLEFSKLYASEFRLLALGWLPSLMLLSICAGLGLMGAFISVRRHLLRLA